LGGLKLVCNLAQVPPEIWMTRPVEAKKWLLNGRKLQQQQDDSKKRSLRLDANDANKISDRN
jgi:hypothetical protein